MSCHTESISPLLARDKGRPLQTHVDGVRLIEIEQFAQERLAPPFSVPMALIVVINNSLITLGIPTTWQNVVIGCHILLGTGVPAWQARRQERLA